MIKIWDGWVRLFHWSLVALVLLLFVSGKTGAGFYEWHKLAGEAVLALLLFRLLWGIFGSDNAKLHRLITNPVHGLKHIWHLITGTVSHYRGHNPAGGWAVIIMLLLLLFQAVTGVFIADEDELVEGAFYGALSYDLSDTLWYLHTLNGSTLLPGMLLLHILMPLFYYLRAKQNLILPMLTGNMAWRDESVAPLVRFAPWWVGALLLMCSSLLMGWIMRWF
ncbi:MAG: cytochrome b/b6 domain-containing protein [Gammaproteobacteria bacterium]|nr:cytochrome b/b6 domain-containing protein [Gammaproteobacteria bacterium]